MRTGTVFFRSFLAMSAAVLLCGTASTRAQSADEDVIVGEDGEVVILPVEDGNVVDDVGEDVVVGEDGEVVILPVEDGSVVHDIDVIEGEDGTVETDLIFYTMDGSDDEVIEGDEVVMDGEEVVDGEYTILEMNGAGDGDSVIYEAMPLMSTGAEATGALSDTVTDYVDLSEVTDVELQTGTEGDIVTAVEAGETQVLAAPSTAIETSGDGRVQISGGRLTVDGAIAQ